LVWAVLYGGAAYELGREFERLEGPIVIFLLLVTVVGFIVGGNFVKHHEAQLTAEAERAMPGPLKLP
jgi:hypothetical protein